VIFGDRSARMFRASDGRRDKSTRQILVFGYTSVNALFSSSHPDFHHGWHDDRLLATD
jgi:hypothetical protein